MHGVIMKSIFFNDLPLCWSSGAMTILSDIHHGQTPPLAVRESHCVGAEVCYGQPCLFLSEKLDWPAASAKFGIWKIIPCITSQRISGVFFLFLTRGRIVDNPEYTLRWWAKNKSQTSLMCAANGYRTNDPQGSEVWDMNTSYRAASFSYCI